MSIGTECPSNERSMADTQVLYGTKGPWTNVQKPDVTFILDPDNFNCSDPKYITYFPNQDKKLLTEPQIESLPTIPPNISPREYTRAKKPQKTKPRLAGLF